MPAQHGGETLFQRMALWRRIVATLRKRYDCPRRPYDAHDETCCHAVPGHLAFATVTRAY